VVPGTHFDTVALAKKLHCTGSNTMIADLSMYSPTVLRVYGAVGLYSLAFDCGQYRRHPISLTDPDKIQWKNLSLTSRAPNPSSTKPNEITVNVRVRTL
jgi:hypothetical protein